MKITIYIDALENSYGTERSVVAVANELSKKHEVEIVSVNKQQKKPSFVLEKQLKTDDLGITSENKFVKMIKMTNRLWVDISRRRADLIISSLTYISMAAILKKGHQPIICWEHASYDYFGRVLNATRSLLYRQALAVVTTNFKDCEKFKSSGIFAVEIPNIVKIPDKCKDSDNANGVFLYVGRLSIEKGVDDLLKILVGFYGVMEERKINHKTFIVGDGPLRNHMIELIHKNSLQKHVFMVGRQDDVEKYYQNADILLCVSKSESFGMTIVEAAHHNVPTISFSDSAGPKQLISDGVSGVLIESRSVNSFVKSLNCLFADPRKLNGMGRSAKDNAAKFDEVEIMQRWTKIIDVPSPMN